MDGTLVDTEPFWLAAEEELVSSFGGTWTHDDGLALVGSGLDHSAAVLRGRGVDLPEMEIIDWLTDRVQSRIESSVTWRPGALELLRSVREAGIPTALVTMSISRMARHVASLLPFDGFDLVLAGDEVAHSKPHPEPYLHAARVLGVSALDCVAIEDSVTGLAAAVASGAVSVGVPLHSPLTEGLGYTIWPTLAGKTVADLGDLFRSSRDGAAKSDAMKSDAENSGAEKAGAA
ncbi:HAD family phosphatase [Lacisediminihabitans sp. G11-30]|uniref:HAD family phosphatase n=2 Tax=Lacisediminihabitans changchengi TaxID=2787634 RepID=A0A934SQB6_9MICO|nr:HAD family phosphatase [Lacisediminihabitans changchengi]MBK4347847.1 HAD family phosphatase [Lacisediminihabitans changchengi]